MDRCDEQMRKFGELRDERPCYRWFTDFEVPFIECIYEDVRGIRKTFMRNAIIAGIQFTVYTICFMVLLLKDEKKLVINGDKSSMMDLWILLNLLGLLLEATLSTYQAKKLNFQNKLCFEVTAYIFKGILYVFTYEAVKLLIRNGKQLREHYSREMYVLVVTQVYARGISFWLFALTVLIYCLLICFFSCFIKSHQEKQEGRVSYVQGRARKYEPGTDTEFTCSICLSDFADEPSKLVANLNCNATHLFHVECLQGWIKNDNN